ncbi:ABC transporter permease [Halobacteria archaeon AArc-m2/3/4]|uniref:ABC transporter permease n=1 Tax=Natronoglomus mannanivorans TaxID=2979990 RepID=A0ABT2QKR2_9EURY|nr:ABC transporter permease [Halobacteria archaeon AArc-m2/3/4]
MSNQNNPLELLETTDDVEPTTRSERWRVWIDLWILTPLQIMWKDRRTRYGSLIILLYFMVGTVGVRLVSPATQNEGPAYVQPFDFEYTHMVYGYEVWQFPLGTNGFGEDIFAQTIHATPAMLQMMLAGGVFTAFVGAVVGIVAGYKRGTTERILMTAADIQIAIPGLPLLIVLAMALQPRSPIVVGLILGITSWAGLARALHSQVLALRSESYVEASRLMGFGSFPIMRDDLIPNIMPFIMINFMNAAIGIIHLSVGLYFLGVLPFTTDNWGVMINFAYNHGALLSWAGLPWLLAPIFAISLLGYGITIFSQGMDRLFNPRVRARHATTMDDSDEPDPMQ